MEDNKIENVTVENENAINDARYDNVDSVISEAKYTYEEFDKGNLSTPLPGSKADKILEFTEEFKKKDVGEIAKHFSKEDILANQIVGDGYKNIHTKDTYYDNLDNPNNEFVNMLNYGDKKLYSTFMAQNLSKGVVNGTGAISAFSKALGIGEIVQIPLWNSGIWVSIKPPKQSEIINLENSIASATIKVGRETSGFIYSNYGVVANKYIADFIKEHIYEHNVKLGANEDLFDYIMVNDYEPLVLGLLATMYPTGLPYTRTCDNTMHLDDNGMPKCHYNVSVKLDPLKLLFVNRKALTKQHLLHMCNKVNSKVSTDEIREYQATLSALKTKEAVFESENGKHVTMEFKVPSLSKYLEIGTSWVEDVKAKIEAIFTDGDTPETKNTKTNNFLLSYLLGIYNSYIYKLKMDEFVVEDEPTKNSILEMLSMDTGVVETYIEKIKEYISNSTVSIVATPVYTCPNCKKEQGKEMEGFKGLIPLNVVENFFDHSALRLHRIRQATEK